MTIDEGVSLQGLNTLRLASEAEYFSRVGSESDLQSALHWASGRACAVTALGEGSNVVLHPQVRGLTLDMAMGGINVMKDDGRFIRLRVAAGENWHQLVVWCLEQGLHGLENLAWIPGSVGAAPVQNIGAYGVELSEFVEGVRAFHVATGECVYLDRGQCEFAYRDSVFKRPEKRNFVIATVDIRLDREAQPRADYPSLKQALAGKPVTFQTVFETVGQLRHQRLPDPERVPNVGSFFKNPLVAEQQGKILAERWPAMPNYPSPSSKVKLSAAWMIDQLGWRGKSNGGVRVSQEHALILVNESATCSDAVLNFASEIADSVSEAFGVNLAIEPDILGEVGPGISDRV